MGVAMIVSLTYRSEMTAIQTIEGTPPPSPEDRTITHNALNRTLRLGGSSTPKIDLIAVFRVTLVNGEAVIGLTNINTPTGIIDATGRKLRAFKFRCPATNTGGAVTVEAGASNGYDMLGGSWSIPVPIDGEVMMYLKDTAPAVASGAKTLDLTGTGTDSLDVSFIFG